MGSDPQRLKSLTSHSKFMLIFVRPLEQGAESSEVIKQWREANLPLVSHWKVIKRSHRGLWTGENLSPRFLKSSLTKKCFASSLQHLEEWAGRMLLTLQDQNAFILGNLATYVCALLSMGFSVLTKDHRQSQNAWSSLSTVKYWPELFSPPF